MLYNANTLSSFVYEKLELASWDEYRKLVAEAYEKAPEFEEQAVPAFTAMRDGVNKFFNLISSKVDVQFVNGDPYSSADDLRSQVKTTKVLKVMKEHSTHPFFTKEENWKLRAVHDWFTHIISGEPFGLQGELRAYNTHAKMFSPNAWPALFTEIVGQISYQTTYGKFPTQKVCILNGFDFKNIGRVEGLQIKNKILSPPPNSNPK